MRVVRECSKIILARRMDSHHSDTEGKGARHLSVLKYDRFTVVIRKSTGQQQGADRCLGMERSAKRG